MSNWALGSKKHAGGERDVTIYFDSNDPTGHLTGWLRFMGKTYIAEGTWAAAGSVPGRAHSILALIANDQQAAPVYLAMAGTIDDGKGQPAQIELNIIRTSSIDDKQSGWGGILLPIRPSETGIDIAPG